MAIAATVGAKSFLGWAPEVTPGTPVAATTYVPMDPDKTDLDFNHGREAVPMALGSLFAEQFVMETEASIQGTIAFNLWPNLGNQLFFLAGFLDTVTGTGPYTHTGAMTIPKFITVEVSRAGQSFQFPGILPKGIKLTASSKSQMIACEIQVEGFVKPNLIAPTSPTYTPASDQPYAWRHMQAIQTLGVAAGTPSIDDLEIEVTWDNQQFRGANNTGLPTDLIAGLVAIKGKYTRLFKDLLDYNQYVADGEVPAQLQFILTQAGVATDQFKMTIPKAFYESHNWKQPLKGLIVEEFGFHALSNAGASPLNLVCTNSTATAYTTT